MTKLTDDDIRQILANNFADDTCTPEDIAFARAIEDSVLERALEACKRNRDWSSVDYLRAMRNN